MIGHKYTPTVGHTGSYAFGDHVRRNLGATVVELGIPPALAVGSVNEHIATHSILNADLVPYKSDKTPKFNATSLLDDISYVNYFRQLIQFIEAESTPDAWIVFYGGREEIKNLLNSFAPNWYVPTRTLRLRADATKKYSHFYLFAEGKRKILLLPFLLTPYSTSSIYNNISVLIDQLKFFEKIVAVAKN